MSEDHSRDARRGYWSEGTPLTLAFLKYGSKRQLRQHVEARGTGHTHALEVLMTGDIFGMLASEDLVAWGFRVAPTPSDGPVQIPPDVFHQPLPDTWRDDVVSASGEIYERITVSRRSVVDGQPTSEGAPLASAAAEAPIVDRGGPRDTYEFSRAALMALAAEDESFLALPAGRLLPDFERVYRAVHSKLEKTRPPPGERTLRNHLKRFRAERSGNNRK